MLAVAARAQVSGSVVDQATQVPLGNAKIGIQATGPSTLSAADGSFFLPGVQGTNLVLAGGAKGYFTNSVTVTTPATGVLLQLDAVPQTSDTTYALVNPTSCGQCHPAQLAQWTNSPMHQAGTNTWAYDLYDGSGTPGGLGGWVYTRDSQHALTNPASECASCHQPEPWIAQPFSALEPIGSLSNAALHGVSCDVCHKIAHIDETKVNYPGIYPGVVTLTRPQGPLYNQVQYGLLGDATFTRVNRMRSSYQPQLEAAVCAACHQDKNDPDQDGDFEESNGVLSEPTYLEWLASPYGDTQSPQYASCVDCHMPPSGAVTVCNDPSSPVRDPQTIRNHRIEGTTAAYLENAASLALDCQIAGSTITVRAVVTNDQTGHHLPTGVTIRNMILRLEAWRDEDGSPLAHTGSQTIDSLGGVGDPAQGFWAGLPGKLYAKFNHDASGHGPVFFTEATGIQWDNRLAALAADSTLYTFAVPPGSGTLHVRARLVYRRSFRAITAAKGWTTDGHGNPLEDVQPPHFGHLMEEATWSTVVTSADGDDGADAERLVRSFGSVPNPARSTAQIRFALTRSTSVQLTVYDLAGRRVGTLVDGMRLAGSHAVEWTGRDPSGRTLAAGVYWCRLEAGGTSLVQRFVLLR